MSTLDDESGIGNTPRRTATPDTHSTSQRYISSRGEDFGCLFEDVVLNPLASDGGLYLPEHIPKLTAAEWLDWSRLSLEEQAYAVFCLFVSPVEVPEGDLGRLARLCFEDRPDAPVRPLVRTDRDGFYLLGPEAAEFGERAERVFVEYFVRRNEERGRISILKANGEGSVSRLEKVQSSSDGSTSGDATACASTPGNLDNACSWSWVRILSQVIVHIHACFSVLKSRPSITPSAARKVQFVVPTDGVDMLSVFIAQRMGLPVGKIIIAHSDPGDPVARFWATGRYDPTPPAAVESSSVVEGHLVSPHFERLLWLTALDFVAVAGAGIMDDDWTRMQAGGEVAAWLGKLQAKGEFGPVYQDVLESGRRCFAWECLDDDGEAGEVCLGVARRSLVASGDGVPRVVIVGTEGRRGREAAAGSGSGLDGPVTGSLGLGTK